MPDRERFLDEVLDAGLAGFAQSDPLAGLEDRVLRRLSQAKPQSSGSGWRWSLAAAAVLAALWGLWLTRPAPAPSIAGNALVEGPALTTGSQQPAPRSAGPVRASRTLPAGGPPAGDGLVRQAVFPAPQRLSAEDRLLLNYLRRTPEQELIANSTPQEPALDLRNAVRPEPVSGPARNDLTDTK